MSLLRRTQVVALVMIVALLFSGVSMASVNGSSVKVDDTDASITFSGNWNARTAIAGRYNDTDHETNSQGASAEFAFTGTSVTLIGEKASWGGDAAVYIDNVFQQNISFYAANQALQQTVYTCSGLNAGTHTIKIVANGSGWAYVDAFEVGNSQPPGNGLAGPYVDTSYFTNLPFGNQSHWLQPWRAYMETVPAHAFVNGIGLHYEHLYNGENADLLMEMLAKQGIKHVRIDIGWGDINYNDGTLNLSTRRYQDLLQACKKWNIRPLLLLWGHHGGPTPFLEFQRTVTANAPAGATQLQLNDTSGLIVGRSGLSNLTDYWAAEVLITGINGNTVTLSKPLPNAISSGTSVAMATLKYRPFSVPGSADYNETINGWKQFLDTVATFAANELGTTSLSDKGFDIEIWNELTFGSNFLYINRYYSNNPYNYDENSIWKNLVQATADYVNANASKFSGVQINDGFANTIPWTASSQEPDRIRAIGKHPYQNTLQFPQDNRPGTNIDALGQTTTYVPSYTSLFPEYGASGIQTETLVRDMSPYTNDIYGVLHGRYARPNNPTPVWITEVGINMQENGITDVNRALTLKGKTTARYMAFYLNKGVEELYMFSSAGGDGQFGIIQDNFLQYSRTNTAYPSNDSQYVSPALRVIKNMVDKMKAGIDYNLTNTRQLQVNSIVDTHNHYQFQGDGSANHPNLYNRELFTFLPYQVNAGKFVIPYYVMTRDVRQDLTPEQYTLSISNVNGTNATVTAYDPINDISVPVTVNSRSGSSLEITVTTTDYPYLLTIEE